MHNYERRNIMLEHEIKTYTTLNKLAESNGTIIFGNTMDKEIPLCELKQAFGLQENLYNRSFTQLSIKDAMIAYDSCIAKLHPSCILIHLGEEDITYFEKSNSAFEQSYRKLIQHIKASSPKCTIGIITLKNTKNNSVITELNKHLKYIAESERVEFEDISIHCVWNPTETKNVVSFIYSTGFVHPLKGHRSIYDLVKILFRFMTV